MLSAVFPFNDIGTPEEHAGIPDISATREHRRRFRQIRLLHKAANPECRPIRGCGDGFAHLDVSVSGIGFRRPDPQRDQLAAFGMLPRGADQGLEFRGVADVMIARQDAHDESGCARPQNRKHAGDGRRGVPRTRFADEVRGGQPGGERTKLFGKRRIGDSEDVFRWKQRQPAFHGKLKERSPTQQRKNLFGPVRSGKRPEPCAAAARH
jgi:hypothetical protein